MEKLKKPCKRHKIAFGSWKMAELEAMAVKGRMFTVCKDCGWIVLIRSDTI